MRILFRDCHLVEEPNTKVNWTGTSLEVIRFESLRKRVDMVALFASYNFIGGDGSHAAPDSVGTVVTVNASGCRLT